MFALRCIVLVCIFVVNKSISGFGILCVLAPPLPLSRFYFPTLSLAPLSSPWGTAEPINMVSTAEGIGEIRHPIAVERLEEYLKRSSSRVEPPLRVLQFSYGQSNPTYMVKDSRGHEYVLRKKPAGALLSSTAHAVEREFRVLKALEGTPFPAPRVFELCQTSDVLDTPFYVCVLCGRHELC